MQPIDAEAIETECTFQSPLNITHVHFEWGKLVVTLMSGGDRMVATVRFSEVAGFRMLDEGNLLEFWPACAAARGWLFLIKKGGWFDLEIFRPGFLLEKSLGLSEYFIASQNNCLSVLSSEVPTIETYSI